MAAVYNEDETEMIRFKSFRDSETHVFIMGYLTQHISRMDWYLDEIYRILVPHGLFIAWFSGPTEAEVVTEIFKNKFTKVHMPWAVRAELPCMNHGHLTVATMMSMKDRR
jgi:ubiquinone/menaquinone biosynthesis C-methylase UbiE